MPALFRRPTRPVTETVHGIDVQYEVPDAAPRLPFNLDAALRRVLFAIAILMTIGAIIWGTVAIGGMLTLLAPAWAAYLIAGIFDAGWAACLIAEWILRYDSKRAEIPARVGIALLVVSAASIITDGSRNDAVLVGIIGALVSATAKGIWWIAMHTVRIKLNPKYEAYLRTLQQQAGTEQALALGERDRMLTHDHTVKLRLALEARQRASGPIVDQVMNPARSTPVQAADQPVNQIETTPEPAPVHTVQPGPDRTDRPVQPEDQVAELLTRLRLGEQITKQDAADILGVSPSTAYRRLTAAKDQLRQYN